MGPAGRRRRLGDLLIEAGLISETQLKAALNEQRKWGGRLGRTVVEMGFVTETAIGTTLARQLELPSIDLDTQPVAPQAPSWLRLDLCERYGVFPVGINHATRHLDLATSDPTNVEHLQALEFATNMKVAPVVATASAIERAIRKYYFGEATEAPRVAIEVEMSPEAPPATPAPAAAANDATYELDALLGEPPRPTAEQPALRVAATEAEPLKVEAQLRAEIAVLREKVDVLEEINTSQVRALRVLLELLIESGLVTRDEYLEKLHEPEGS
jgi:type IV pilus assembly protein PilB